MKLVQKCNIVEGKRRRVMTAKSVLSVITAEVLKNPCQYKKKKKNKKNKKYKKIKQQKRNEQIKNEKPEETQDQEDGKVIITKSVLRELIKQHFYIVDDGLPSIVQEEQEFQYNIKSKLELQKEENVSEEDYRQQ